MPQRRIAGELSGRPRAPTWDLPSTSCCAPGQPCLDGDCAEPRLSVLIDPDEIWVGVSRVNEFQKIPRTAAGHDWAKLEETLKQHVRENLANYKVPRVITVLDELPRGSTGKILRNELKARVSGS